MAVARHDVPRLRRVAQQPASPARSVRHQRHEGRAQRRAELQHPRRLVGRVLRRRERLGDRLRRRRPRHRSPRSARGHQPVRSARARDRPAVLRPRRAWHPASVDQQDEGQLALARAVRHRGADGARLHHRSCTSRRRPARTRVADNDWSRGTALATWKATIIEPGRTSRSSTSTSTPAPAHEGDQRTRSAHVELGGLDAGEVTVQLLHGPIDSAGSFIGQRSAAAWVESATAIRIFRSRTCRSSSSQARRKAARRRRDRRRGLRSRGDAKPACSPARRARGRSGRRADAQRAVRARRRAARGAARAAVGPARADAPSARRSTAMRAGAAAQGGGLRAASAGADRRLHRLLRRHPSRDQCRAAAPARQPAAAELQAHARSAITAAPRRSWSRAARSGGRTGSASRRPRPIPSFGPCARLDYELELGICVGPGNALGHADPDRRGGRAHRRLLPAQRLVGARHPGLGVPAARAVPRQELRDHDLALGGDAGGAGAVPHRAGAAARRAIRAPLRLSRRRRRPGAGRVRHRARGARSCTAAHARQGSAAASLVREQYAPLYWTVAQMVAHHSCNGCNLVAGRPVRQRHHLGAHAGRARQHARADPRRPAAGHAAVRRDAAVPRGRRRGDPARICGARALRRSASANAGR